MQRNISYTQRATSGGVVIHGDEGSLSMGPMVTSFRTVFSPPWTDNQHVLELEQTVTQTWTGASTAQGQTMPLQGSRSIRFVAREPITVPAGTFDTCRYEQTQPGTPGPVTTWIARGWGIPVQVASATSPGSVTRAWRFTVDGSSVQGTAADHTARVE